MKKKDINIEIEYTINTSVNYLDVLIINENGQLRASVYHKPTAQLYYLLYTSDRPHKYYCNIPYTALIRAARLCSNIYDFNVERLRIEISLLLGRYPPKFITNQFLRFFQVNNAMSVITALNQHVYQRLHQQLMKKITEKQKKLNDSTKDPVKHPAILQKKSWDTTVMYARYRFESGSIKTFLCQFHKWWTKYYKYPGCKLRNVKVRLQPKTNRTLAVFLIHKKPPPHMLRIMDQSNN